MNKEAESLPIIKIEGQDYQIQNKSQLEFIERVKAFCEARNKLERFLLFHRCADIETNHVSCLEPVINYSSMYSFNFFKSEPNLRAVRHITEEKESFNRAIFHDLD